MRRLLAGATAGLFLAAVATPAVASAAPVTSKTKLTQNGLGPIRVGMTVKEARAATGQRIHYTTSARKASCEIARLSRKRLDVSLRTTHNHISFVLLGNEMNPNGGLTARFPGLTIPHLNVTFGDRLKSGRNQANPEARDYWVEYRSGREIRYTFLDGDLRQIAGGRLPENGPLHVCP